MKVNSIRRLTLAASLASLLAPAVCAADPSWPQSPIKMIVGFAAGGPTDQAARVIAKELGTKLGTPVVVENKPGANGTTSIAEMKRQKPDGYTILFVTSGPLAVAPARFKKLPFNVEEDFAYIGTVSGYPSILVSKADRPYNSVADLVAQSWANKDGLSAATVSNTQELTMALFKQQFNVNVTNIPYKGDSQSITDVASGTVDFAFVSPNVALPMIEMGRVKGIGATGTLPAPFNARFKRIEGLEILGWNGIVVAKATPPKIQDKLRQALASARDSRELHEALSATGQTVLPHQGDAFRKFVLDEVRLWEQVMAKAGLERL